MNERNKNVRYQQDKIDVRMGRKGQKVPCCHIKDVHKDNIP